MKYDPNLEDCAYLYEAILAIRDMQECKDFFETLCTTQELRSFAQRIRVAKLLHDGCVYSQIVRDTGASTATISRVNRSMSAGSNGYDAIFAHMADKST